MRVYQFDKCCIISARCRASRQPLAKPGPVPGLTRAETSAPRSVQAIERVGQLSEAVQDEAAEILLSLAAKRAEPIHLDDDTREAVREGKAQSGREDSRRTRRWPRSSPPRRMRARE